MFVMVAGRRQGKTSTIVNWLMEHPGERAVIVNNRREGELIERALYRAFLAHNINVERRKYIREMVIVASDIKLGLRLYGYKEIAIDDAERVLETLFGNNIGLVTMNATLVPTVPARVGFERDESYVDGEEVNMEEPRWIEHEPKSIDWSKLNPAGPDRFA